MDKHEVAFILEDIGTLLELRDANPFKIRAYHNAARAIESLDEDLEILVKEERLKEIPNIGERIADKITILIQTGHLPFYEELKQSTPEGLLELLKVPGLGGKKIKALYEELGIKSVEELESACKRGDVAQLAHFGKKTQENLLKSLNRLKERANQRFIFWTAYQIAIPVLEALRKLKEVEQAEIAGSLRRSLETIGDLDFVVASSHPEKVMDWFTKQISVEKILVKGPTKSTVIFKKGIQADLRVVPKEQFGFALLYFTGSKEHCIHLRQLANDLGYTLNEYTIAPLDPHAAPLLPKSHKKPLTEEEIYKKLGLVYIPPELREDMGEIEAAKKNALPLLVQKEDIRGVFHCHTTDSDGHNTLEEMVQAAESFNWEYFGLADHSKSSYQANGMDEERLFAQIKRIKALNSSKKYKVHVFTGVECDILTDGTLDFSDAILKELDYVVVSVHRSFKQDEETMTKRLIKAIENPYTTIVGHVTGRLLIKRDPYAVNLTKVIDACIANNKIMELNAQPYRLDLDWRYWKKASQKGLKCAINPDAHRIQELKYFQCGVMMARKGWLKKENIFNALSLKEMQKFLSR